MSTTSHLHAHPQQPPSPQHKKRSNWLLVSLIAAGMLALIGCIGAIAMLTNLDPKQPALGDPIPSVSPTGPRAATSPRAPTTEYDTPVPADFTLTLTELRRACFGSAGCNVTFTVTLTKVNAARRYDPAKSYRLVYAIGGAEDSYSNYLTITGDQYSHSDEEFVQVKSKSVKLTPTITEIVT